MPTLNKDGVPLSAQDKIDIRAGIDAVPVGAVTTSGLTQSTARLLGRTTAGTGAVEEITVGSGLSLSAGTLTATSSGSASAGAANTVQLSDGAGAFLAATGVTFAGAGRLALAGGSLATTGQSLLSVAGTFNGAGQTLDGFDLALTDTASAAASRALRVRVGGSDIFSQRKDGFITYSQGSNRIASAGVAWRFHRNGSSADVDCLMYLDRSSLQISQAACLSWASGSETGNSISDLTLWRDAANILAQRNGTAAQFKRLYGTFTDSSNGRWLEFGSTTAGVFSVRPTGNGTGASGNVLHISGLPTSNPGPGILWNNAGTPAIGT